MRQNGIWLYKILCSRQKILSGKTIIRILHTSFTQHLNHKVALPRNQFLCCWLWLHYFSFVSSCFSYFAAAAFQNSAAQSQRLAIDQIIHWLKFRNRDRKSDSCFTVSKQWSIKVVCGVIVSEQLFRVLLVSLFRNKTCKTEFLV